MNTELKLHRHTFIRLPNGVLQIDVMTPKKPDPDNQDLFWTWEYTVRINNVRHSSGFGTSMGAWYNFGKCITITRNGLKRRLLELGLKAENLKDVWIKATWSAGIAI